MASKDFHHPYRPYAIQQELMEALYKCIEDGQVGIFESPTAEKVKGKSLSLICASLTWLRDHKRDVFDHSLALNPEDEDEPTWVIEHMQRDKRKKAMQARYDLEARLARVREKEKKLKWLHANAGRPSKRRRMNASEGTVAGTLDDSQFELADYDSDSEMTQQSKMGDSSSGLSAETAALMKKLGMFDSSIIQEEDVEEELKIIYCSRTHSQLAQFATELKKVKMPASLQPFAVNSVQASPEDEVLEELKHLTLGSRRNLCINPKVNKLTSVTAINERCLELQKPKTSADGKCPFLPTKDDEVVVKEFRDTAIAQIRDIEELGEIGRRLEICPYYASRAVIKPVEILTVPYPLLLLRSAREALTLSLKDHVVIIDEAHNLMDAISSTYSAEVTLNQLVRGKSQLMVYLQKFRNRLKGKNRVYVTQTVRLLDSLITYLQNTKNVGDLKSGQVVDIGSLMAGKGVDQINVFKLAQYLQESKLARKVDGYIDHTAETQKNTSNPKSATGRVKDTPHTPVLLHIQSFLLALMNPSDEGRFFLSERDDGDLSLNYMLLDPAAQFRDVVDSARAVILAGGTMSPMEDYTNHLFSYLPASRITTLSCGHVIPSSNLAAWPVIEYSNRQTFDFTFGNRSSQAMIIAAGQLLLDVAQNIPDGVVVFFPSYAYLETCVAVWKTAKLPAENATVWEALSIQKPIFTEVSKRTSAPASGQVNRFSGASSGEEILRRYSHAINSSTSHRGALLLSVIGGSLSEGINFSDQLGRGVVVFGLPFPNPNSAEWKAKKEYIAAKAATRHKTDNSKATTAEGEAIGKSAARDFYENATMRAVNQAVGRAIRHKDDYAVILMVDRRYESQRIRKKLPGWIQGSLRDSCSVTNLNVALKGFFDAKERRL